MPAHNKNKKSINLLTKEGFEHSTGGRILHWLLTAGRTIVVITELIVIIAFLSRFWLDRTLTDLSEQNSAKKAQIEASQPFEKDFKSAQERLKVYKAVEASKTNVSEITQSVASSLPAEVTVSEINISEQTKVVIKGISLSEAGIAGFLNSLSKTNYFNNVSLTEITLDTRGSQVIQFALKADLVAKETGGNQNGN